MSGMEYAVRLLEVEAENAKLRDELSRSRTSLESLRDAHEQRRREAERATAQAKAMAGALRECVDVLDDDPLDDPAVLALFRFNRDCCLPRARAALAEWEREQGGTP